MKVPTPTNTGKNRIDNPSQKYYVPSEAPANDLLRTYMRLRHFPTGFIGRDDLRWVFSLRGGKDAHAMIQDKLSQLEYNGLVAYEVNDTGRQVVYHIVVEPIPDEVIMNTPKVNALREEQVAIIKEFRTLESTHGVSPHTGTVVDYALVKSLLQRADLDKIVLCAREYWKLGADHRKGTFKDFFWRFPEMENRVMSDVEMALAIERDRKRKNAPKPTTRDHIEAAIKQFEKEGDMESVALLRKELEDAESN